ncbi:hypothetical protein OHC33_000019 [Knufia fluminis]|uniref:HhH-GPD domain-containing protein n=1 Tax=Knufia fluminis TaxID=191047 RepID=A0AAN8ESX6_9EURO|nr:hypothetical protein OHC33_000019 [Knufia fluminis]
MARKASARGEAQPLASSTPSRSSARMANKRFNAEYGSESTPVKQEDEDTTTPKANMSVKRAAPSSTPQKAKRVKIEAPEDAEDDIKAESEESKTGLPSPDDTDNELSDAKDMPESDFSASDDDIKPRKPARSSKSKAITKKTKSASASPSNPKAKSPSKSSAASPADKAASLQAKKLKEYSQYAKTSPFPDFPHPTPDEARLAHKILSNLHGARIRPEKVVARNDSAGCGDSPSVLDALVRTILSQNTSDKNSTRAKRAMDEVYGASDKWDAIANGGQSKLQDAIKSGGLAVVKSKVIISILEQTKEKYGEYSLDHLFNKSDEEAMTELISMKGVGPKTASCVLLFCLQRASFAVDTHVYRIAGLLGWRPKNASRDETHAHLEVRIPDEEKYGLHILMVGHGKMCEECKAGGKSVGKCELRKAFKQKKLESEAGEDAKEEEEEEIKQEGDDFEDVKEESGLESGQEEYVHGMEGEKRKGNKQVKKTKPKGKK